MRVNDIPEIARLTVPEKILLLEDLWDSIASDEASIPVPASHRDELDRRLAQYEKDPGQLLTLDDLRLRPLSLRQGSAAAPPRVGQPAVERPRRNSASGRCWPIRVSANSRRGSRGIRF